MSKYIIILLALILGVSTTHAQKVEGTKNIYKTVEQMPEYPGGQEGLLEHLSSVKYPTFAKENNIEGTVYVQFVIDKKGKVSMLSIARSSKQQVLDDAALQVVSEMDRWKPGKEKGKRVKVQYVVPIRFKLS